MLSEAAFEFLKIRQFLTELRGSKGAKVGQKGPFLAFRCVSPNFVSAGAILITFSKTHVLPNGFLRLVHIERGHPYFKSSGGVTDMKIHPKMAPKSTFEKKMVF